MFWKWLNSVNDHDSDEQQPANVKSSAIKKIPILRYYHCFNLEQTEGIKPPPEIQPNNTFTPINKAEQIIENMQHKPDIQYGGSRACYAPAEDVIQLPEREAFHSSESYYSTLFHELSHATGHVSRLARKGVTDPSCFGSHDYSQEELVAEFAASMLCGAASIEQQTISNSAAYIQGWLSVMKGDKRLAVIAAGQAQRAADFILNRNTDEQDN